MIYKILLQVYPWFEKHLQSKLVDTKPYNHTKLLNFPPLTPKG